MRTHCFKVWIHSHYAIFVLLLTVLIYFLVMDALLYLEVQRVYSPDYTPANSTSFSVFHSSFQGLSVKLIMTDHMNNYVYFPLAVLFVKEVHTWPIFQYVTANSVSFVGVLFGFVSAKYVSHDSVVVQRVAVLIFGIRNWLDAVDGVVARHKTGMVRSSSQFHTPGYVVDGTADTIATAAFLLGCYYFLRSCKQYAPLPVHSSEALPKSTLLPVVNYGFQIAFSCLLWNRYILSYGELLDVPLPTKAQQILQAEVATSPATLAIMWFWRILNSHALIEMLLLSILLNRLWDFLVRVRYIGFFIIASLGTCSEIYLRMISSQLTVH